MSTVPFQADTPEHIGELRVMIQFVPDTNKSGKEKGRGSLNVWIQQARGFLSSCDQGTYLLWSVDVVIVNILAIGLL